MKLELTDVQKENISRLNELMDIRVRQFKEIYQHQWWENLIEDEMYKFLCQKLAEVKSLSTNVKIAVTDEELKSLSIGLVSPKEYVVGCPKYSSGHSIDVNGNCNMGCC